VGAETMGVFREVKELFDPADVMNPGLLLDPQDPTEGLDL
jgi:FAD/FMN-containing dehydrogenase